MTPIQATGLSDGLVKQLPGPEIVLATWKKEAVGEMGTWKKLLSEVSDRQVVSLWIGVGCDFVASALPESAHPTTYLTDDLVWVKEFAPSPKQSTLAIFSNSQEDRLVFLGLPTEEGLDRIALYLEKVI